eukprot:5677827-Amphidinium_carterae.1
MTRKRELGLPAHIRPGWSSRSSVLDGKGLSCFFGSIWAKVRLFGDLLSLSSWRTKDPLVILVSRLIFALSEFGRDALPLVRFAGGWPLSGA